REDRVEDRDQLLGVRAAWAGLGKARVFDEVGATHRASEGRPEPVRVHQGELEHSAVARLVVDADAAGLRAGELGREGGAAELGLDAPGIRPGAGGEERRADLQAAARALAREEGERDGAEERERGGVIARAPGELAQRALRRQEARLEPRARPVDDGVIARLVRLRPRLAERRGARVDEARVEGGEVVPAKPEPRER